MYQPLWSDELLQEVNTVLVRNLRRTKEQAERRIQVMRDYFPEAIVSVLEDLSAALSCIPDPKDRHVLAAAIRGGAQAIVTSNVKHFPANCLGQYDVVCQSPDEFLVHQFHLNPDLVLQKLDEQAASIKQERAQIIERLKLVAPSFAAITQSRNP